MRGEPITADFALDEGFRRFYARFTVSKRPMGTFALLSAPWVALKLTELALAPRVTGNHLFTVSFWVILLIPAEIILLFELLMSCCTWFSAVHLQESWLHLLDGEWHADNPKLSLSLGGGHADVSLVGYGPPTDRKLRREPSWRGIDWILNAYRKFTPLNSRYELSQVTSAIWGETYALLLLGGRSRLFMTAGVVGAPAPRARITPAVPVPLARMTEEERARLRRALDRRGIPVREVHDENWLRRALRTFRH